MKILPDGTVSKMTADTSSAIKKYIFKLKQRIKIIKNLQKFKGFYLYAVPMGCHEDHKQQALHHYIHQL